VVGDFNLEKISLASVGIAMVGLILIFQHDPYLDAGQEFPLWTNG
jgi:hypothetical protein